MSHHHHQRVAASGGAAFTVLAIATVAVVPPAPDVDASASEIRSYLADEHDMFGVTVGLMGLAILALVLVLGYLYRRLSDAGEELALRASFVIAAAVAATCAFAGVLLQGVLAQHTASGIDDSSLLLLYRTWQVIAFMGPPLPMTVVLLVAALGTLRSGIFPRWMAWSALEGGLAGAGRSARFVGDRDSRHPAARHPRRGTPPLGVPRLAC